MPPRADKRCSSKIMYRTQDSAAGLVGAANESSRRPEWFSRLALAGLTLAMFATAHAAGLGRLAVHSALGQPLDAQVEIPTDPSDDVGTLQVRLASPDEFKEAGIDYNAALASLHLHLGSGPDGMVLHLTSARPVNEPYLDLLLELSWSGGRVVREYTILLDPPALREAPQIVAPTAVNPPAMEGSAPAAAAPAVPAASAAAAPATPATPAPAPTTMPTPAPASASTSAPTEAPPVVAAPAPVPAAPAVQAAGAAAPGPVRVRVHSGDTLTAIAAEHRVEGASLDQMMVAMLQANPSAFLGGNVNRLRAGRTLEIPSAGAVQQVDPAQARREIAVQSADFAAYRERLARAAAVARPVHEAAGEHVARGRVTAKVEDRSAAAAQGDRLKIARGGSTGTGVAGSSEAALARKDEATAHARAMQDAQERIAALEKSNADIQHANALAATSAAPVPAQSAPKPAEVPVAVPHKPVVAHRPVVHPAPAPAPAESGGVLGLLRSPMVLGSAAGALLLALLGVSMARRKRAAAGSPDADMAGGEGRFSATGGQNVDTGATSTFNSSFIPAASQLHSNEVDPVAEADVYIAYGREEQAEDILKESLRMNPERHAVRAKLMEIYARRGDSASFEALARDLHERTGGVGAEWERAAKLGYKLEASNPLYVGGNLTGDAFVPVGSPPKTEMQLGGHAEEVVEAAEDFHSEPSRFLAGLDEPQAEPATEHLMPWVSPVAEAVTALPTIPVGESASRPVDRGMDLTADEMHAPEPPVAHTQPVPLEPAFDFSALDFDLGPTKIEEPQAAESAPMAFRPEPEAAHQAEPVARIAEPLAAPEPEFEPAPEFEIEPPALRPAGPESRPEPEIEFAPVRADDALAPTEVEPASAPTLPEEALMGFGTDAVAEAIAPAAPAEAAAAPAAGSTHSGPPTLTGAVPIPEVDLRLPDLPPAAPSAGDHGFEEALSRPTLLGAVASLSDDEGELTTPLALNTDQATVPLIDFDLSGAEATFASGRRAETQAGSPLASQMATKLDLARGYIDLGVKDGARELLEEVMKDGTREQRQQAVELTKLLDA